MDCRICRLPATDELHITPFGAVRMCAQHGSDLVREMDVLAGHSRMIQRGLEPQRPRTDTVTAILTSCRYGPQDAG